MSDKHVKKIESASLPKVITNYGYNRNMHLGIRRGPKELGAVDFYPFKTIIGATRIKHITKNWRTPTQDIGKTLRIAMVWTQYSAEVPYPKLSETTIDLLYVKERKILTTSKFLNEYNGIIHLEQNTCPTSQTN